MWISVSERLPDEDMIVDVWCKDSGRHTDYKFIRNYNGQHGNDFFEVVICGRAIILVEDYYDPATHWMPIPTAPKEV